jgi:hypothetical protein
MSSQHNNRIQQLPTKRRKSQTSHIWIGLSITHSSDPPWLKKFASDLADRLPYQTINQIELRPTKLL